MRNECAGEPNWPHMRKRYFAERVDPILEKIARQGMESLTKRGEKDSVGGRSIGAGPAEGKKNYSVRRF